MIEIPLESGGMTRVSDMDFEYLDTWVWSFHKYVYRYCSDVGDNVYMHLEVFKRMALTSKDVVDHKDRDRYNNQRENLRAATFSENSANRDKKKNKISSRFKGVQRTNNKYNPWLVHVLGKNYGPFPDEEQAARIRDSLVKAVWGEFAVLNFPD